MEFVPVTGVVLGAIAFFANFVKAVTGFGGGFLFISLLRVAEVLGLQGLGEYGSAVALVTVLECGTTWPLAISQRGGAHWPVLTTLYLTAFPLVPVGGWVLAMGDASRSVAAVLQRAFGGLLLIFVVIKGGFELRDWFNAKKNKKSPVEAELSPLPNHDELHATPETDTVALVVSDSERSREQVDEESLEETRADAEQAAPTTPTANEVSQQDYAVRCKQYLLDPMLWGAAWTGLWSGFLGGLFGAGGPPVMVFFSLAKMPKAQMRSTGLLSYAGSLLIRLIVLAFNRLIDPVAALPYYLCIGPASYLGVWIGHKVHKRFSERAVRTAILLMLVASGAMLAGSSRNTDEEPTPSLMSANPSRSGNGSSPITTHVLDTSLGMPGVGVHVSLDHQDGAVFRRIGLGITDSDGRVSNLLAGNYTLVPGVYRITFATGDYMATTGRKCFYPEAAVTFEVEDPAEDYHVPLLLNPFGYSTYRGS